MAYQILNLNLNEPADALIADWVFDRWRIARDINGNEMFNPQGKPIYNQLDAVVAAVVAKGSSVTIYDYLPTDETYLDGKPLSERTAEAKEASVDWFIARVILPFLGQYHPDVYEALVPRPAADEPLKPFARPEALRHPDIQAACEKALDTPDSLQAFLNNPGELMATIDTVLSKSLSGYQRLDQLPRQFSEFAGVEGRPGFLKSIRDDMELTFSAGDQNTYLLVGVDQSNANAPRPHQEGWDWLRRELDTFGETNGFVPSFGFMTSDARRYQRVIAGPGVGQRALDYLRDKGCTLIDRSDGQPIGSVKDYLPPASTETSEQKE